MKVDAAGCGGGGRDRHLYVVAVVKILPGTYLVPGT